MQLRKVKRKQARLRIGVAASSGMGKSYSSLLLAKGLVGDWGKIAVIDSENGSADLYEHLGEYNVLTLNEFSPEKYIEAIKSCEKAGMEVIIVDSISHEWAYCLELHGKLGGKFADWSVITPKHNAFKQAILQSSCHVITTVRRATDYAIDNVAGKTKITKVGLKEQSREGWEYELTLNLVIDENHLASASKDRTGLFVNKDPELITEEHGKLLAEWSQGSGSDLEEILQNAIIEINNSSSHEELKLVHRRYTELHSNSEFMESLKTKKEEFLVK